MCGYPLTHPALYAWHQPRGKAQRSAKTGLALRRSGFLNVRLWGMGFFHKTCTSHYGGIMRAMNTRIALIGLEIDAGASRRGARLGPFGLRAAGLAGKLTELGLKVEDWGNLSAGQPSPERKPGALPAPLAREDEVLLLAHQASDWGHAAIKANRLPIFLGGDHSLSMGSVSGVARACAEARRPLHVLWLDAHADFNTPRTSPSGNLHGMSLAMLCGETDFEAMTEGGWLHTIDPRNVTILGARSLDKPERQLLAARGVEVMDMRVIDEFGVSPMMRTVLARAEAAGAHLHVSLDTDVLDPALAPGTGTPVQGGLTYREAHLVMEMLHDSGLVGSLDIVEFNPLLDERGATADVLVGLTASLFGQRILERAASTVH
jgi:arginase